MKKEKGRVTGLGGIFFKSDNPDELKKWYSENLHFNVDEYGHTFSWKKPEDAQLNGYTQWSIFNSDTEYLNPSKKDFMINYRVENLEDLLAELKEKGMQIIGDIEEFDYGKFGWVMDPDGNKIELWEPVDEVFDKPNDSAIAG